MHSIDPFFTWTELDRTTLPQWRAGITEAEAIASEPRSYPGYPRWPLSRHRPRMWPALDRALLRRRSASSLGTDLPGRSQFSRLLQFSHAVHASGQRGPVPSAGGLQALELYLATWESSWLPAGLYHYDRSAHCLAQITPDSSRKIWLERVPSLGLITGGALLWVLIGDTARVCQKYGERGLRFLLLEAGHLMQNICLMSAGLGLATVPLGGYLEKEIAQAYQLPAFDRVLYLGVCGKDVSAS